MEQDRTRQRINTSQAAVGLSLEDVQVEGIGTGCRFTGTGTCIYRGRGVAPVVFHRDLGVRTSPAHTGHP